MKEGREEYHRGGGRNPGEYEAACSWYNGIGEKRAQEEEEGEEDGNMVLGKVGRQKWR